ncbi:MAG TPA: hypothetical protein VK909_04440 [Anaerolineales bacterium]|nr:hypothetical protein [Anaerolineales bacterium]
MATSRKTSSNGKRGSQSRSKRASPGTGGQGEYYHVEVRPGDDFVTFRTQDVGDPGHLQRVAGKRESGGWATVKWLIGKEDAHVEDGKLVGDTQEAKDLLKKLRTKPILKKGDVFESKPRQNVPERSKPTAAQKRARSQNIRKAQTAKRSGQ